MPTSACQNARNAESRGCGHPRSLPTVWIAAGRPWDLAKRRSCVHLRCEMPDLECRGSQVNDLILLTNMLLAGKLGIVFGVANKRSIAWAIAQAWHKAGAKLAFTYQGERLKENVEELAGAFGPDTLILPCDVAKDEDIARVFAT